MTSTDFLSIPACTDDEKTGLDGLTHARWRAAWISAAEDDRPALTGALAGLDAEPIALSGYEVLLFRREFDLDDLPAEAYLRIASDSRHLVYLNGDLVAYGPLRAQPRRLTGDLTDVMSHLRHGRNTLAVEVTYYGSPNALWMPAQGSGELGTRAALICELHTSPDAAVPAAIVTDDTWSVHVDQAAHRIARSDVEGVPAEVFDARKRTADWTTAPTVDGWQQARALRVGHMSGGGRAMPPADPYGAVPTVRSNRNAETSHTPRRRRTFAPGEGSHEELADHEHPTSRINHLATRWQTSTTYVDEMQGEGTPHGIVEYDFGRIVTGRVEIEIDADRGTVFDLDFREHPVGEGPPVLHGMRYIARGHDDRLVSFETHGLRYLAITTAATTTRPHPRARIADVTVREASETRTGGAYFRSNDNTLNAIWSAGVRTVQVNSADTYTDCPTREQRAWVGDGVIPLEVDLLTTANHDIARRYVWLAMSPRADGLLPMAVAGDIEFANSTSIPAWSLHWVHALFLLARHDGVDDLVSEALPVAERSLRWFEAYADERGTLRDIPEWCFVDWSSSYTHGRSSIMTALWARALRDFALLSRAAGNTASARRAEALYETARVGFEDFWDADRGLYVDTLDVDPVMSRATSQLASATAIASRLAPQDRWPLLAERIADPRRLVERSWFAKTEGFDVQAIAAASMTHPAPDWDVETQIVRAQPFGSAIVHEALAAAKATPALLRAIRDWEAFLREGGDTFGEGWGWGTTAHAWSSAPTRDLVAYILGAEPSTWGGTQWRIQPALGPLATLSSRIPTRHGAIDVDAAIDQTVVDTPVPVEFVTADQTLVPLAPGRWRVRHRGGTFQDVSGETDENTDGMWATTRQVTIDASQPNDSVS